MKKTARKTEPEEWNQKEIKAYKFGTLEDALYYALTGGLDRIRIILKIQI